MSSTASEDKPAGVSLEPTRKSPIFLAVFAVFLVMTSICMAATLIVTLGHRLTHRDAVCFWASGQQLVHGRNPYDPAAIDRLEATAGWSLGRDKPFLTRNPPSALFLMAPLGVLNSREASAVWALLLGAFFVLSVQLIRGASTRYRTSNNSFLLAYCFAPALACMETGQTGIIAFLGLAVFLRYYKHRPFWSGAALSICTIKPHLFLPFGLVLVVWIFARKKWAVLSGAVLALVVESAIAMVADRAVWAHYFAAIRAQEIGNEFVPTVGVALRFVVARSAMWLEFVPAGLGCIWALWYFWRNHKNWDWRIHGSLVTLVSLAAAPYSWFTDQVIALPAVLFVLLGAQKLRRGSLTLLFALMSASALEMILTPSLHSKIYIAQCLAWLAWYLYATSSRPPVQDVLPAGVRDGNAVSC